MDNYNSKDTWVHEDALINLLALQLLQGRLALFLGAGTSAFYGLPDWRTLVDRICALKGADPLKDGDDPILRIGALKQSHYQRDHYGFLKDVHDALYEGATIDFEVIRKNSLLAAIGALAMASKRGSASQIVTLNFDDLLELYLEFHGFVVDCVDMERHWAGTGDVRVLHPHGLLPLEPSRQWSEDIVFGIDDYLRITDERSLWRAPLQSILRSHTTIYIGLSGTDQNLQNLVADLKVSHPFKHERHAYHGVRFATAAGSDIEKVMDSFGVKTHQLASWDDLPKFLFKICQAARSLRGKAPNAF